MTRGQPTDQEPRGGVFTTPVRCCQTCRHVAVKEDASGVTRWQPQCKWYPHPTALPYYRARSTDPRNFRCEGQGWREQVDSVRD